MIFVLVTMTEAEGQLEALQQYKTTATQVRDEYGAKVVSRYEVGERLVGGFADTSVRLLAFDSEEQVKGWLSDERYVEVIPLRERAFRSVTVSVLHSLD
ncbi:hypothetical protein D3C73_966250 [compost metagenome]